MWMGAAVLLAIVGACAMTTVPQLGILMLAGAWFAAGRSDANDQTQLMGILFLLAILGVILGLIFGGLPAFPDDY